MTTAAEPIDAAAMFSSCLLPRSRYDHILLGHGSGGQLSNELIRRIFVPGFDNAIQGALEDQATIPLSVARGPSSVNSDHGSRTTDHGQIAFTTDSFVVKPLFFPGGDIGKLAVHGTVNDLAVGGATPLCLSAAFILEEGLALADLQRIVDSMRQACQAANVQLVTGDTKVVDRGKGDQIFITTSGIGLVPPGRAGKLSIRNARPGDQIIVSGTVGDHGIAIMSVREGIEFETVLESDSAPLSDLVRVMLEACPEIHAMRDPTRGGLSSTFNEMAEASRVGVRLDQAHIPIKAEVKAACEMLGLDPLYVANEGKLVAAVPAESAQAVLAAMRNHPLGRNAAIIGQVVAEHPGMVILKSIAGGERVVTMISGEQLPRIC